MQSERERERERKRKNTLVNFFLPQFYAASIFLTSSTI
jgi:hypothetical protein